MEDPSERFWVHVRDRQVESASARKQRGRAMRALTKTLGVLLGLVALFAFGFTWRDLQQGRPPSVEAVQTLLTGKPQKTLVTARTMFVQAFDHIRTGYYKKVDSKELKYAGLGGLMNSLGDPHTQYLEPQIAKEFDLETRGKFVGIGARLQGDPLGARVDTVFEEGPARRGGTFVSLELIRKGVEKPFKVRLKREPVVTPSVEFKMIEGALIGYVSVISFSEPTTEQFANALSKLSAQQAKGFVIDLRGNPGGLLEVAVVMLEHFVNNKVVVKMKMRDGTEEVARTGKGRGIKVEKPVVVLIDGESASAAEIFAGVLKDYRLATLVGEHTYGKASVQAPVPLVDGALAKITIARYYLPSGLDISRKVDEDGQYVSGGLEPDVVVEFEPNGGTNPFGKPESDNQLRKAIEVLQSKIDSPTLVFEPWLRNSIRPASSKRFWVV
ncbi:MAG: S41 family peptidase [Armatimonadetes bacterium]|nr:MAG: S41 family peptidase [Armatimonadota bacterium]